jgi:uncharacterized protein with GYD domain
MPTYVALVNWTQKGIQEFGESPSRVEKAKAAMTPEDISEAQRLAREWKPKK